MVPLNGRMLGLGRIHEIVVDFIGEIHGRIVDGKNFFRKDPFPAESLFSRSDNFPFAQQGVPAHTIIATHPRDRFYHSLNDEPATLDYAFLAKIVRAVALGAAGLIDGSQTPTRIDPMKISE